MKLARVLGLLGRISLTAGVLILLFVVYQLWGTGLHEARAQGSLSDELDETLADAGVEPASEPEACTSDGDGAQAERPPAPEDGAAIARIALPRIGVDKVVVEGVSVPDLKRGPGRFPETSLPGYKGNVAIAGHRTTYGAPFHRIDELEDGDEILLTTAQGCFRYIVNDQRIVAPDQVEVLDDFGDSRLTLVACHPKYSAAQRIVVVAELDGDALEPPAPQPGERQGEQLPGEREEAYSDLDGAAGLSGDRQVVWPTFLFAFACALIWLAAWMAAKVVGPWVAYTTGTPFFLVMLFFTFEEVSRLLPANF